MARRHRFHSPASTYHIMLRGNDGQPIFFSDHDKHRMCLLLQEGTERFNHHIEAFCFMSNHIHLAVKVGDISISQIVHHLAFRYTQYINKKYKRIGHLFQGRFKSVLVDDEKYLKELIRYIHLNPVRAAMTDSPENYFWSSHQAYLGLNNYVWLQTDRVLAKFYSDKENALISFKKYVMNGIGVDTEYDFKSGTIMGMIGDQKFVDDTLIFAYNKRKTKINVDLLIQKMCEDNNLSIHALSSNAKHPKLSKVRAIMALLVRESENVSLEKLAAILNRDASGLTKLANRLEIKILKDSTMRLEVDKTRQMISQNFERMSDLTPIPKECQNVKPDPNST